MNRAARPTRPLALRVGVAAAVAAVAAAALPAAASAASISIGANSPANNALVGFTGAKKATTIEYSADLTACTNPRVAPLILEGGPPRQVGVPAAITEATGTVTMNWRRPPKTTAYRWTLALLCDEGAPIGAPEVRTIRLKGASPHPKLEGRFILNMLLGKKGKRRFTKPTRLTFLSSKKAGVFRSQDNFKDVWKYNKKSKKYRMRTRFKSSCQVGGRTIAGGSTEQFTFVAKVRKTDFAGGQRFVKKMSGTWAYLQKPTAKGRAAGCGVARSSGRAILVRKGKVIVR